MIELAVEEFTAKRRTAQRELEDRLRPFVKRGLRTDVDTHGWIELLQEIRAAWKGVYLSETGLRPPQMPTRFRDDVERTLRKTKRAEVTTATEDRITIWLATAILGNVTMQAATDDPTDLLLEWVTMGDSDVRHAHREAQGQRRKPGEMFEVGGHKMPYPGWPGVPIELWINCRCSPRVVLADATLRAEEVAMADKFMIPDMLMYEVVTTEKPVFREVSTEERKRDADAGRALPDGSYPIDNCSDLKNAIQAIGRAKDPAKAKAHIRKRKSALGCPEVTLPDTWATEELLRKRLAGESITYAERFAIERYLRALSESEKVATVEIVEPLEEPTHAGVAVVARDTGRALMIQRSLDQDDAPEVQGTWEFPGGTIEEMDESPEAAAWREFCEETGLPKPEGEMVNGWRSADGIYQGFVYAVPVEADAFEEINPDGDAAYMENPDNPERRHPDVSAWFSLEQMQNLGPALRPEIHKMDWSVLDLSPEEESMTASSTEPEDVTVQWHSVFAPEGVRSGDGRRFGVGSLRARPLPLPLTWQKVSDDGHRGNVTVAKTDRMGKVNNEVRASGTFLMNAEADEVIGLIGEFGKFGVSVDADDAKFEMNDDEECVDFTDARVASACIVPIPAFAEAWIKLGPPPEDFYDGAEEMGMGTEVEALVASQQFVDVAPGITEDGPGWLTHPVDTDRLRDYWTKGEGAAKIAWGTPGDFNRCRVNLAEYVKPQHLSGYCANRHYDALGIWPGEHLSVADSLTDTEAAESIALVASGGHCAPSEWFEDPKFEIGDGRLVRAKNGKYGCPLTITEEGEVFVHLALWNVCHASWTDRCVIAPHSNSGYAYFMLGSVLTDKGLVATGPLTIGGGHAPLGLSARPAMEHYDDASTAWADVVVGEDQYGIWAHGWVRPGTSPEMVHAARASKPSGDWRQIGRDVEMIAAHSVNTPGFAVPRVAAAVEDGVQTALVAAGVPEFDTPPVDLDVHQIAAAVAKELNAIGERKATMAELSARFKTAETGGE